MQSAPHSQPVARVLQDLISKMAEASSMLNIPISEVDPRVAVNIDHLKYMTHYREQYDAFLRLVRALHVIIINESASILAYKEGWVYPKDQPLVFRTFLDRMLQPEAVSYTHRQSLFIYIVSWQALDPGDEKFHELMRCLDAHLQAHCEIVASCIATTRELMTEPNCSTHVQKCRDMLTEYGAMSSVNEFTNKVKGFLRNALMRPIHHITRHPTYATVVQLCIESCIVGHQYNTDLIAATGTLYAALDAGHSEMVRRLTQCRLKQDAFVFVPLLSSIRTPAVTDAEKALYEAEREKDSVDRIVDPRFFDAVYSRSLNPDGSAVPPQRTDLSDLDRAFLDACNISVSIIPGGKNTDETAGISEQDSLP